MNSSLQVSWEYCSGSVRAASVKVPYFGDWMINFMNDSNRNLFIICPKQHFWSFLSGCLSNDWWNVFFFEIGRDVEGIEVLEVLFRRTCGAGPPLGMEEFLWMRTSPQIEELRKKHWILFRKSYTTYEFGFWNSFTGRGFRFVSNRIFFKEGVLEPHRWSKMSDWERIWDLYRRMVIKK